MPERREIGSVEARGLIALVTEKLDADGLGAAVAVVDPHGELVAFLRTDGCGLASINIAMNKAFTAARERVESSVLGERSRTEGFPITNFGDSRYVGWGGGVPIIVDGHVIGAIGVSVLPEEADIELARWAAASAHRRHRAPAAASGGGDVGCAEPRADDPPEATGRPAAGPRCQGSATARPRGTRRARGAEAGSTAD